MPNSRSRGSVSSQTAGPPRLDQAARSDSRPPATWGAGRDNADCRNGPIGSAHRPSTIQPAIRPSRRSSGSRPPWPPRNRARTPCCTRWSRHPARPVRYGPAVVPNRRGPTKCLSPSRCSRPHVHSATADPIVPPADRACRETSPALRDGSFHGLTGRCPQTSLAPSSPRLQRASPPLRAARGQPLDPEGQQRHGLFRKPFGRDPLAPIDEEHIEHSGATSSGRQSPFQSLSNATVCRTSARSLSLELSSSIIAHSPGTQATARSEHASCCSRR